MASAKINLTQDPSITANQEIHEFIHEAGHHGRE